MNQAAIFNALGTGLLFVGLVLHLVCLSTPYYCEADMSNFAKDIYDLGPKNLGLEDHMSEDQLNQMIQELNSLSGGGYNFGMWKVCLNSEDVDMCVTWGTNFHFHRDGTAKTFKTEGWVRAVQAMAILTLFPLVLALAGAVVNLVVKSKGDRMRLLYLMVVMLCIAAALFLFIGDMIIVAKYKTVWDPTIAMSGNPLPKQIYEVFKDQMALSWGFAIDLVCIFLILLGGLAHFIGGRIVNSFSGVV